MNEPASELCRFYNYLLLEDSLKIIRPYTTLFFVFFLGLMILLKCSVKKTERNTIGQVVNKSSWCQTVHKKVKGNSRCIPQSVHYMSITV